MASPFFVVAAKPPLPHFLISTRWGDWREPGIGTSFNAGGAKQRSCGIHLLTGGDQP